MRDALDKDSLSEKVSRIAKRYPESIIEAEQVIQTIHSQAIELKDYITDTSTRLREEVSQGSKVLLEGAQGLLLSIEYGTYPYVTSSDCSAAGTAVGAGISPAAVDRSYGLLKFPFMTRVGAGPFPSELGERASAEHCDRSSPAEDLEIVGSPYQGEKHNPVYDPQHPSIVKAMSSDDEFVRGAAIRLAGSEFGATTGRLRRVGWTDLVAARYAADINGPDFILTKPDVLDGADDYALCNSYEMADGTRTTSFPRWADDLQGAVPGLVRFEGYEGVAGTRSYEDLHPNLLKGVELLERYACGRVHAISTGADRHDVAVR